MPELPRHLRLIGSVEARILDQTLGRVKILNAFVLRCVIPPLEEAHGKPVSSLFRLGKRIVIGLEPDYFLVIHLMVAGRLRWLEPNTKSPGKIGLASSHFAKRKSHVKTRAHRSVLFQRNRKRYSDEILHRAKLSPLPHTQRLNAEEIERLFDATRMTLREWTDRLRRDTGKKFPDKVTAFRPDMAVHGRFGPPWPVCASPVQRILRRQRNPLLRPLPDRRRDLGRPRLVAFAQEKLAACVGRS